MPATNEAAEAARQIAQIVAWLEQMPEMPGRHGADAVHETVWTSAEYAMEQHPEIGEHAEALREQLGAIDPSFDEGPEFWYTVANSIEAAS